MKIENSPPLRIRAALYIRVSTEEQALHGLSIDAQTAALDAWAKENRVRVVDHYVDAGISARKPAVKRPALQRLLRDVQAGKVDQIVFTKLDRWFRNIAEYYKVQEVLERHNVDWRTIHEDYETSTSSGRLKVNIMLTVAQDEADRTSERIKAVFENKVQRGEAISGKIPFGYKIEDKKTVIDPEKAEIVRDIFREYAALRSIGAVRKYALNTYGLSYAHTSMQHLLKNPRYIGFAHGQDDFCPAIIEPEQFKMVQEILQQRSQRNATHSERLYLFSGLVYCAECGKHLNVHVVRGKYIYYYCSRYSVIHQCTHHHQTSEIKLEKWLLENIVSSFEGYNLSIKQAGEKNRSKIDASKIRGKMDKLKDLYLNDLIERDAYERDYTGLREQLRVIQEAELMLPKPVDTKEIKSCLEAYNELSRKGKQEFWRQSVGKIVITKDDRFSVTPVYYK